MWAGLVVNILDSHGDVFFLKTSRALDAARCEQTRGPAGPEVDTMREGGRQRPDRQDGGAGH